LQVPTVRQILSATTDFIGRLKSQVCTFAGLPEDRRGIDTGYRARPTQRGDRQGHRGGRRQPDGAHRGEVGGSL